MVLARQLYPRKSDNFLSTYEEATKRNYGYLFIDLKPKTPENQRLKTNILPEESSLSNTLLTDTHNTNTDAIRKPILELTSLVQTFLNGQSIMQPPQVDQVVRL